MKKIGIDARLYNQTGVGTYLQNLLEELQGIVPNDIQFIVYVLSDDSPRIKFKNNQFIKRDVSYRWHSLNEQIGFLNVLNTDCLDLMHFTYFSYPILYQRDFITTIHDLTPLLFKTGKASTKSPILYNLKHLVYRYILKNQVLNAKQIITPTNTVKNQIIKLYGQKYQDRIIVTYEGISKKLLEVEESKDLLKQFNKSFFIYVGNFYPHKNVNRLIEAFNKTNIDAQLILVGPDDYFAKQLISIIKTNKRIILYTTKNVGDIKFFYKHAKALIHPSLSEGFGLPLIESAYFNCPIIASDIPVFNELLGDRFIKFDPENIDDMSNKITQFFSKPVKLSYKSLLEQFSFKEMAKKTLDQYKKNL